MRTHSPFFEAMLRGPWLEAHTKGPITLPDDHPAAFELMCKILYHQLPQTTPLRHNGVALALSPAVIEGTVPPERDTGLSVERLVVKFGEMFFCRTIYGHERCRPVEEWKQCLLDVMDRPGPLTKEQLAHFKRFEA